MFREIVSIDLKNSVFSKICASLSNSQAKYGEFPKTLPQPFTAITLKLLKNILHYQISQTDFLKFQKPSTILKFFDFEITKENGLIV